VDEKAITARSQRRSTALVASAVLLIALSIAYSIKPDSAAALTIFPAWTWLPAGLLSLLRTKRAAHPLRPILLIAWIFYGLSFSEEWRSLLRLSGLPSRSAQTIRIASLNCAGGMIEAARETGAFSPDIVLLQESPGRTELQRLAQDLYGAQGTVHVGPDGSILARGRVFPYPLPRGTSDFVAARVELPGHPPINVVSLRLMPPAFRVDLLSPSAWTEVRDNRRARRREMQGIVDYTKALPRHPLVMGGDFNAQSGDPSIDASTGHLTDSFYPAGRGWCHTAVNDYPLARIDRVYVSKDIHPQAMIVQKTVHSDHRIVVVDVRLPQP
jgi:hypothetical protein